jgi:hypothetical protein
MYPKKAHGILTAVFSPALYQLILLGLSEELMFQQHQTDN